VRGGPGTTDAGQITYTNVLLQSVMLKAYDLQPYQLSAPDWVTSKRYDIAAKIPPGTTPEQFGKMLQNLLAERFQMVVRHETKEMRGFDLVTGRGGSKLKVPAQPPFRLRNRLSGMPTDSQCWTGLDWS
jgi:uncharacterized protein (TIGR03435 family)